MDEIQQFSLDLANNLIKCSLEEFYKMFNDEFYKDENIDFMEYFLSLVPKRKEFCVEPIKLQEYKVLNNINTSGTVLRTLKQYDLEEGTDYLLYNVVQSRSEGSHGGSNGNKREYRLTPSAFKLCLIRAKNSKVYAKYYMRYEEMYYYYKYYQTEYQNKVLSMKDDKIDNLEKKLDDQSKKMDDQSKRIDELLNYGKKTSEKLDEVQEDLNYMNDEFENLHEKVDDMKEAFEETANRSVPDPEDDDLKSEYILLQSNEDLNNFVFIRGIKEFNETKMRNRYNEDYKIVAREFNSNPIQLFKLFKKIVVDEFKATKEAIKNNKSLKGSKIKLKREAEKIKFNSTKLELKNNFTKTQLLNKIKEIAKIKFETYNESTEDIP